MKNSDSFKEWIKKELERREPGYLLPATADLARDFGLAPITVHRIIRTFSAQGKVVRTPGKGTVIAGPEPDRSEHTVTSLSRSAARELADTILASIARGEYKKGDTLPQLTYMAYQFNLSYRTVIAAYRLLVESEQVIRTGKTFRVGTFRDSITPGLNREIYILINNSDDFSDLYRSDMRYAYRKMENELNAHGFRINYAHTRQLEELFARWKKEKDLPHALLVTGLESRPPNEPFERMRRCFAGVAGHLPRVLFDSTSLRIQRQVVQAPYIVLARGHATTASVRALGDYMAEKGYERAILFMDGAADSWVVGGDYFAMFRLAWEMYDRRSPIDLRFVIQPIYTDSRRIRYLRRNIIPHRIGDNARRKMNPDEERLAKDTADGTVITASFPRQFRKLYSPGVLWVFNNDEHAAAALEWAKKEKISVPEELSIIGLNHNPAYFHLGLSYCGPDWDTLGYQMAHALIGDMPIARTGKGFLRTRADMFRKRTSR